MARTLPQGAEDEAAISEEYQMPCLEALLAGTLALMTGFSEAKCVQQRNAMSQKIFCNLGVLSQHPLVSPGFQALTWKLRMHWLAQASDAAAKDLPVEPPSLSANEQARALWHTTPEKLQ